MNPVFILCSIAQTYTTNSTICRVISTLRCTRGRGQIRDRYKLKGAVMSTQKLFKFILASTILLPVTFTGADDANAQKFKTRQHIINGLQIQNPQQHQVKRKKHRSQRRNQQVIIQQAPRHNKRVLKRRAPPKQQIQVSAPKRHKLRAPPANNGQLGVSRVPPSNPQLFRVPPPRATERVVHRRAPPPGNAKFRAPPSDVDLSFRRAPQQQNQNQQIRAPRQNAKNAKSRPPNRNPQHFNSQVTNVVETNKDRAIRVEQNVANYYDNTARVKPNVAAYYDNAASVDLEILFDYNSARISPDSVRQLFALGEALQDVSLDTSRILIAGHTDAAGSNAYNNDLSYRRAQSVSDFLINYAGVPSNRLATEGYGEELLKYPDAPNSGQNRRVEIINLGG